MHIAFDAKRVYQNGTGLGHYSRTLVSSLARYFPQHQYTLLAPKITNRFDDAVYENISTVVPQHFPGTLFKAAWRSRGVVKELKPMGVDLYHGLSHEIPVGIQSSGIPSVVTMHDLIFERYPAQYKLADRLIHRNKIKYAAKHANRVIAISKQTRDDLVEIYKIPESKIDICYQSCNPSFAVKVSEAEKERVKKQYGLPEKYFLYVGSIIERKNLLTICEAIKLLDDKLNIPLVAIGEGRGYKEKVKAFIREHGLEGKVILLSEQEAARSAPGFRSAADFPAIYQSAVCMIYPSYFEGFGIPVLEALWSGLPTITSNVSCMPETGGDAAYYVDPGSAGEMAMGLERIVGDAALRTQMIDKGYRHAATFSQEACAKAVMNVYESVI